MARNSIKKADLDLDALTRALKATEPEEVPYQEVLETLRAVLDDRRSKGVSIETLSQTLKDQGIAVSARSLKMFLDTGDLQGRPPAKQQISRAAQGFMASASEAENGGANPSSE